MAALSLSVDRRVFSLPGAAGEKKARNAERMRGMGGMPFGKGRGRENNTGKSRLPARARLKGYAILSRAQSFA
ncbi:hypothetical protein GCM10009801_33860 [Streptomyces albiaxialis]|uniref:50S ribosomal protein L15 n=1 Tax=Streptomyces albiaxialis TaxID=329523 RepID=A0ABP5HK39_9ACTN